MRSLLVLSGGHPYEAEPFDELIHSLDNWDVTHLVHPEAEASLDVLTRGEQSTWWQARGRSDWERGGRRRSRRIPVERETPLIGRADHLKRLRPYCKLQVKEVKDAIVPEREGEVSMETGDGEQEAQQQEREAVPVYRWVKKP